MIFEFGSFTHSNRVGIDLCNTQTENQRVFDSVTSQSKIPVYLVCRGIGMSDYYEPGWVEIHWRQLQIVIAVVVVALIILFFQIVTIISDMEIYYILLLGYAIIAIYSIYRARPYGGTAKERLERNRFRLSLYIKIIGDILAVSDSPVETFHDLITHFISIKRFTDEDLSLIMSHFAGRADEIGDEVRRLVREDEGS
jgi:hypothetical protein